MIAFNKYSFLNVYFIFIFFLVTLKTISIQTSIIVIDVVLMFPFLEYYTVYTAERVLRFIFPEQSF